MNKKYPHPLIAREGWPFIGGALVAALLVTAVIGFGWSIPLWIFLVFCVQFFRDPERPIPQDPKAVLCPADGRVIVIENAIDPYRQCDALKISVFMNVFNVHSQRSPVDGTVEAVNYHAGSFLNAALVKASSENERNAVLARLADGTQVTFVQIAGLIARRILCYTKPGDVLKRGQRYGFIRFGSRVDVYLPRQSRVLVTIGEKVFASSTVLAELP